MGDATIVDSMLADGLTCSFDGCSMGLATERHQRARSEGPPTRGEQDAWALRSHQRAAAAAARGAFADELVALEVPQRRGAPLWLEADEGVRPDTTLDSLAALRPAFEGDGTITAGNASQISDGAAALVLASADRARELGLPTLATITAWATVAGPDASLLLQPAEALRRATSRAGLAVGDLDLVEINEAFASVAVMSGRALGLDEERLNVNGGAIALGHPIGTSGARIVVTLVHELRRRGGGMGGAALCGGGGQGDALTLAVG
jgi:acetyl-CoA C-acetyltransferase